MPELDLLTLDLRAAIAYRDDGAPPGRSAPLAEGDEELLVFEEAELLRFDPDEGPRARRPLPSPSFRGLARPEALPRARSASPREGAVFTLERGRYLFAQFRPANAEELLEGVEWFAREAWWEGCAAAGPYILRRLREDGRDAVQILRREALSGEGPAGSA